MPRKEQFPMFYGMARAVVAPSARTKRHRLRTSEVYSILEGQGLMHIDRESAPVKPGQAVYIPPGAAQWIEKYGSDSPRFSPYRGPGLVSRGRRRPRIVDLRKRNDRRSE